MFLSRKKRAYLDWASAAPVLPEAQAAFMRALETFGNPSSPHSEGVEAAVLLEESRTIIARLASVKPRAVVFTSGATEANALAIQGRIKKCLEEGKSYKDLHVLYLPTMHSSVLKTLSALARKGVRIEPIPLANGAIDRAAFATLLRPETVLIASDAVCGETGTRFDTLRLKRAIDAANLIDCALLVDASQLPLVESIDCTRLGADLMVLDAQKVGGVRGIGALIVPNHDLLAPIAFGGGQEAGLRPGTEPVAGIAAFARALSVRAEGAASFNAAAGRMRAELVSGLQAALPSMLVNVGKEAVPHILNLSFPGLDTDYLVMILDAQGFAVSTRSACETDSEDGSPAVRILTDDPARAASTLRISWGPETNSRDLSRFANELIHAVRFLEENAI